MEDLLIRELTAEMLRDIFVRRLVDAGIDKERIEKILELVKHELNFLTDGVFERKVSQSKAIEIVQNMANIIIFRFSD